MGSLLGLQRDSLHKLELVPGYFRVKFIITDQGYLKPPDWSLLILFQTRGCRMFKFWILCVTFYFCCNNSCHVIWIYLYLNWRWLDSWLQLSRYVLQRSISLMIKVIEGRGHILGQLMGHLQSYRSGDLPVMENLSSGYHLFGLLKCYHGWVGVALKRKFVHSWVLSSYYVLNHKGRSLSRGAVGLRYLYWRRHRSVDHDYSHLMDNR